MTYTAKELHEKVFEGTYKVYEVFKHFFGEENVDLQDVTPLDSFEMNYRELDVSTYTDEELLEQFNGWYGGTRPHIYVHWDTVTVTNEHDRSIVIQDLYAKITLASDGRIPYECHGFLLNRSTYTQEQWYSDYQHSHTPGINRRYPERFQSPCLGTGPIKGTIAELKNTNDEVEWMLFCQELSIYVTVESLTGHPHRYLEEIGASHARFYSDSFEVPDCYHNAVKDIVLLKSICGESSYTDFIEYYLRNGHLKFNFANGSFSVGMSYFNYMMDISNCFISFFNERYHDAILYNKCIRNEILETLLVKGNKFFTESKYTRDNINDLIGRKILTFKGRDVFLEIIGAHDEPERQTILSHILAMDILTNILKVVNYRYKNNYNEQLRAKHTKETTAPTSENVRYI